MTDICYLIKTFRWGYTNEHSYIVGCTGNLDLANKLALEENQNRGGKYGVAISKFEDGQDVGIVNFYSSMAQEKELSKNEELEAWEIFGNGQILTNLILNQTSDIVDQELINKWNNFKSFHLEFNKIVAPMIKSHAPKEEVDKKSAEIWAKYNVK